MKMGTADPKSVKAGKSMCAGEPGECPNAGVRRAMRDNMGYLGHFANESILREGHNNKGKIGKVMGEFKAGTLHSGSKHGPKVKSRKQAVAIAMSEAGMSKME